MGNGKVNSNMLNSNLILIGNLAIRDENLDGRYNPGENIFLVRYDKGRATRAVRIDNREGGMAIAQKELSRLGISTPLEQIHSLRGVERFAGSLTQALRLRLSCAASAELKPLLRQALDAAQEAGAQVNGDQLKALMDAARRSCVKNSGS